MQPVDDEASTLDRCARWIERREYIVLAVLLLLTLFADLRQSAGKPLWYDELFTVAQTLQPTLHRMVQGAVFDGNPPTYALICKLLTHLWGFGDIVFRFPSLLAFVAAYLMVYAILRRRTSAVAALMAVAFLCSWEKFAWYATEARPYGFLFLFTAITMAGWLLATEDDGHRRLGLVLIPVGMAGAILSHYLGLINTGLPLAAGVLAQTMQRRRIDRPLWLVIVLGGCAQCITLPLMLHSHSGFSVPAGDTTALHILLHDYAWMLAAPAFAAIMLLLVRKRFVSQKPAACISPLAIAAIASVATPLLIFLLMRCTHTFYGGFRYGIGAYVGIGILLGLILERLRPDARLVLALLLLVPFLHWVTRPQAPHLVAALALVPPHNNEPIVVQDPGDYMQAWWYATPAVRTRLHFVVLQNFGSPQDAVSAMALDTFYLNPLLPMPAENYSAFLSAHRHFGLLVTHEGNGRQDYLFNELQEDGYTCLQVADSTAVYGKIRRTRILYEASH